MARQAFKNFGVTFVVVWLCLNCVAISHAQKKQKKTKKSVAAKQAQKPIVSVSSPTDENLSDCLAESNEPKPETIFPPTTTKQGLIISDCVPLNLTVTYQPEVSYPPAARTVRASGVVKVDVVFDEQGKVIWAQVIEGHPLLRAVAIRAACQTRFKPVIDCMKNRLKMNTVLTYNFNPDK